MFWNRNNRNRKWQARPQLYKGRFFYLKRVGEVSLSLFVLVALVSMFYYFRNSTAFGIKHVEVLGDMHHLSKDDVITLSGIKNTDKLFTIDLGSVQKNISRFYWVKEVRVRREFPSTIQIHVTERTPSALLLADNMYLIDELGIIFKKWEKGDPQDLPAITGFSNEMIKKYPRLTKTHLNFTVAFLNYLETQDFYKSDVLSEVHFDSVFGFTVYTKNIGIEIYYGRDDFMVKQQKLEKFKLSEYYNKIGFVRLDLDSQSKVIARVF